MSNKIKIRGIDGVDAELIREAVDTAGELLASRLRTARESAGFRRKTWRRPLALPVRFYPITNAA